MSDDPGRTVDFTGWPAHMLASHLDWLARQADDRREQLRRIEAEMEAVSDAEIRLTQTGPTNRDAGPVKAQHPQPPASYDNPTARMGQP